jgi:glycosyltransferase 2 family protein
MRRAVVVILSIVVSAFFLWLVLRDVPLAEIVTRVRQADIGWLLIAALFTTLALWTRGIRWRGLLGFRITRPDAFYSLSITQMLNQLPLRAGEVARSMLVTRHEIPFLTAAASILVERVLDTLLVVLLVALGLTLVPDVPASVATGAALFGAASVVAFVVLLVLGRYPAIAYGVLDTANRWFPPLARLPLKRFAGQVLAGIQPLTRPRSFTHALAWTLIAWAMSLASVLAMLAALGITGPDMPLLAVMMMSLASFAIAVPVSVASLGPFEASVVAAGLLMGLPESESLASAFLMHGLSVGMYLVWGAIGVVVMGVSLGSVVRGQAAPPAQPGGVVAD